MTKKNLYWQENSGLNPVDENGKLIFSSVDYVDTWKAMEACVQSGLTRSIGLSNFNSYQLQRVLDTSTIKPVTNQVDKILLDFSINCQIGN